MYSSCDAACESLRHQANMDEEVPVTWGILRDARKALLHMNRGNKEREEGCFAYRTHAVRRGFPLPRWWMKRVETLLPGSERIRCNLGKMENGLDKVPDPVRPGLKVYLQAIRPAPSSRARERRLPCGIDRYENSTAGC